jgi:hypothetical protein
VSQGDSRDALGEAANVVVGSGEGTNEQGCDRSLPLVTAVGTEVLAEEQCHTFECDGELLAILLTELSQAA